MSMKDNVWAVKHIELFAKFWTAIHAHPWHYAKGRFSQQALCTYQAQQRKRWHLATGTAHSWSLAVINQDVLCEMRDVLITSAHKRELSALTEVSHQFD